MDRSERLKLLVDDLMAAPTEPAVPEAEVAETVVREIFRRVFDLQELGSLSFIGSYRTYQPPCGDVFAWVTLEMKPGHPDCCSSDPVRVWGDEFHTDLEAEDALSAVRRRIEDRLADSTRV